MNKVVLTLFALFFTINGVFAVTFKDMPESHWASDSVNKIVEMGITRGFPDGTFRGTKTMNRYDIAIFLAKMSDFLESKITGVKTAVDGEIISSVTSADAKRILIELRNDLGALDKEVRWIKNELMQLKTN